MRRTVRQAGVSVMVFVTCCICLPAARAQEAAAKAPVKDVMLGDFEDGIVRPWWHNGGKSKLTIEASDKAHGKKWMKMVLDKPNMWPGAWRTMRPELDWSKHRALRFSVFNPNPDPVRFAIRADDADTRGKYEMRYNRNQGLMLQPGMNHLEVTVASLKMGSGGCRGQDVRRMRYFALFITDQGYPFTLYLDNVHLVAPKKADAKPLVLDDFEGHGAVAWRVQGDATYRKVKRPDGGPGWVCPREKRIVSLWPTVVASRACF